MAGDETMSTPVSATPAGPDDAGADGDPGHAHDAQIDSSDEYDPTQDVSLPEQSLPDSASRSSPPRVNHSPPQPIASTTPAGDLDQQSTMADPTSKQVDTNITKSPISPPQVSPPDAARSRLPHDTMGILEDRIRDDPKGDMNAWLSLIDEHKKRGKIDEIRKIYDRFFVVFPQAAEQWIAFAQIEGEMGTKAGVEQIFNKTLKKVPNLALWCTYLDHVRRYYNISLDKSGTTASQINHAAYEAVLDAVGIDKDSGKLWQDYIQFIKSGPGVVGQSDWQAQSKMDLLRKAYQRAICVPMQAVEAIWKDYSNFEMSLNKTTGRKFLQEKSPDYMTARSSYTELQNMTRDLRRTTLPVLPPALGFDGDVEYMHQVDIWRRWIQWEKTDPLVLKDESLAAYKSRIVYVYKQALMALRFWPEMWFDAADFCFDNDLESDGNDFLAQGIQANSESCLLAFKRADRLEMSTTNGNDESSKLQRGLRVREPYDQLLEALYALVEKAMKRAADDEARIEADATERSNPPANGVSPGDEDHDDDTPQEAESKKQAQLEAVRAANSIQITILNRTISHAWVALMRAMQRMQGKGTPAPKPGEIGGSRQVFTNARRRGRLTSDVWIAAALLEFHTSDSESAKKIFERGMKLFPEDEKFCLEYVKLLTTTNDHTNARAVFETTVNKLLQKPELVAKAKPLFAFFHRYESHYGELAQVVKLENRMREAFPDEPRMSSFSQRFTQDSFDPTAIRPLISPATQTRSKTIPSIDGPPSRHVSPPAIKVTPNMDSPKRPLPLDEPEPEAQRPRKLPRGESPLAGAAGRRLKQSRPPFEGTPLAGPVPFTAPPPLPREVNFLLSVIPPASAYNAMHFKADEIVRILRETPLPTSVAHMPGSLMRGGQGTPGFGPPGPYQGMR